MVAEPVPMVFKTGSSAGKVKQGKITNEDVLRREVPWSAFKEKGIISKDELELMYQLVEIVQSKSVAAQAALIEMRSAEHAQLFKALLTGVNKDEVVMYILSLLDELLKQKPTLASLFHAALYESGGAIDVFEPMLKLLSRQHLFVLEKTTVVLAKLLSWDHYIPPAPNPNLEAALARKLRSFAAWAVALLKNVDPQDGFDQPRVVHVLGGVQQLVSSAPGRIAFVEADGLPLLLGLMSGGHYGTHSAVQLLYVVMVVVWSLSYTPECASKLGHAAGLVPKLVDILKSVQKEKVVRVTCAALRNLVGVGSCSSDMIGAGVMKALLHLQQRKWADEDVKEDVDYLVEALEGSLKSMSSWDVYAKEVASGRLEWSPSHRSDHFWKDNYKAFEQNDGETLKQLVGCLASPDPTTLAVACHDVGELIKVHPEGRRLVAPYQAKAHAMKLLKHEDPEVQKYALTCVQRLMVINWEYLNSGS